LGLSKQERLAEIIRRVVAASPFSSGAEVLMALEENTRDVEDLYSGVPENPDSAESTRTDGRMYPPNEQFEVASGSPEVRIFRQRRHKTFVGENGALRICSSDGRVLIDLAGDDGRSLDDLL
jgi:hypothetical protein